MDKGDTLPPLELMRDLEREGQLCLAEVATSFTEIVFSSHPYDLCPVCTMSTRVCQSHCESPVEDEFCIWCFADRHRTVTVIPSNGEGNCEHRFHRPCLLLWGLYLRHFRKTIICPLFDCRTHFNEALIYREVKDNSELLWIPDDLPYLQAASIENAIKDLRLIRYYAGYDPEENDRDLLFQMHLRFKRASDSSLVERGYLQEDFAHQRDTQLYADPEPEDPEDTSLRDVEDAGMHAAKEFLGAVNWGVTEEEVVSPSGYDAVVRLRDDGNVVIAAPGDEGMGFDKE